MSAPKGRQAASDRVELGSLDEALLRHVQRVCGNDWLLRSDVQSTKELCKRLSCSPNALRASMERLAQLRLLRVIVPCHDDTDRMCCIALTPAGHSRLADEIA